MNAWEIKQEIQNCVKLEDGTVVGGISGEVLDTEALDQLQMGFDEKVRNIALWIKQLDLDIPSYKTVIDGYTKRMRRDEHLRDDLKEYLSKLLDGKKRKTIDYEVSFRRSKSVEITDYANLDAKYLVEQKPRISLASIRDDLKEGKEVRGAKLVEKLNTIVK